MPPAAADLQILRDREGSAAASSRRMPARASSTSATASCVEFHSKMNTIGGDTIEMLHAGVEEAAQNFAGARRRQRGAELLRRREHDAAAPRSAGGQLGRGGPDGARVPERDHGAALSRRAGGRRAGGPGARRRLRDCAARAIAYRRRPKPTSAWSKWRRADPRRRRHEGDAGARDGAAADAASDPCRRPEGIRDDRLAKVSASATRRAAARLSAAADAHHDEPRAPDGRCEGARRSSACARVSPAGAAHGDPGRRRSGARGAQARRALAWRAGRISDHDALIGRKLAHILGGGALPHATTVSRAVLARSRARGVPEPARRAQDAGAHPAHAEDGKAAEKLTDRSAAAGTAGRVDSRACRDGGSGCARRRRHGGAPARDLVFAVRRADQPVRVDVGTRLRELRRAGRSCARRARSRRRRLPACRTAD